MYVKAFPARRLRVLRERGESEHSSLHVEFIQLLKNYNTIMPKPQMPKTTVKNLVLLQFVKNFCKFLIKKLAKKVPKKMHNKLLILQKSFNSLHTIYLYLYLSIIYHLSSICLYSNNFLYESQARGQGAMGGGSMGEGLSSQNRRWEKRVLRGRFSRRLSPAGICVRTAPQKP